MLLDYLPETVFVDGEDYEINTSFRVGIKFELLMQDSGLTDREKLELALNLFYKKIPKDIQGAVDSILWFYECGKAKQPITANEDDVEEELEEENISPKQIYSYEFDDSYFYSAFMEQYNIDLQDIEDLHWWKFKALFLGLSDKTQLSKIMGYRAIEINADMSKQEKQHHLERKRLYALPDTRSMAQKEADFNQQFSSMF